MLTGDDRERAIVREIGAARSGRQTCDIQCDGDRVVDQIGVALEIRRPVPCDRRDATRQRVDGRSGLASGQPCLCDGQGLNRTASSGPYPESVDVRIEGQSALADVQHVASVSA